MGNPLTILMGFLLTFTYVFLFTIGCVFLFTISIIFFDSPPSSYIIIKDRREDEMVEDSKTEIKELKTCQAERYDKSPCGRPLYDEYTAYFTQKI